MTKNPTNRHPLLATLLWLALPNAVLTAQDVCLSEVHADAGEGWIELHNRGATTADLSTWSLHHATHSPWMPQNYWWPFPAGTTLLPGEHLRVHWFQNAPANAPAGELYTGTSPYGFLFGLGGEPLAGAEGAVALFRSQANAQMNSAAVIEDWLSWGGNGFQREPLAVTAGLWAAGRTAPSIPAGNSLARDVAAIGATAFPDQTWFVDPTPTPGGPNVSGAVLEPYGAPCTLPGNHLIGQPTLHANSLPLLGNAQFTLELDNTTGIYAEFVVFAFSAAAAPPAAPSILPSGAGGGCQELVDATQFVAVWLVPGALLRTEAQLPLVGLSPQAVGAELHVQALVLQLLPYAYPPYEGLSNALRVVVGQ